MAIVDPRPYGNINDGHTDDNLVRCNGNLRGTPREIHDSPLSGLSPERLRRNHNISPQKPNDKAPPRTLLLTNPFENVAELETLKCDFAQQPNWKASLVEGESWEGTTDENIAKWHKIMGDESL
jgi:hypothetical protein